MCPGDYQASRSRGLVKSHCTFEALEPRQMLSVSLNEGVLTVDGTSQADTISVAISRTDHSKLVVNLNGKKSVFSREGIERVRLLGRRGDDLMVVNQLQGLIEPAPEIRTGPGNDRVIYRRRKPVIPPVIPWSVAQPAAPTGLTASRVQGRQIDLSWTDNAYNEAGFILERSEAGAEFFELARLGADTTVYSDEGLRQGVLYTYRVRAYAEGSESPTSEPIQVQTTAFRVFDGTVYADRPDSSAWGLEPIHITYANGFSATNGTNYDEPDELETRAAARRAAERSGIMVIDIEHWPMDIRVYSEAEVRSSMEKFTWIIGWIRDERPELKVGIFGALPWPDYRTAIYGDPAKLARWQAANDFLQPLADQVDMIFPELYAVEVDGEHWTRYAQMQVEQARRYGKPVYVFLSDRAYTGESMPAEQLRLQLATARRLADGAVLWGGWLRGQLEPWSAETGWWQVAPSFLANRAGPAAAPEGLQAGSGVYGSIDLSWQDRSDNEDGFVIERSSDGVNFVPIAIVGPDTTSFHDDKLIGQNFLGTVNADTPRYRGDGSAGMTYSYRVRAHNRPEDSAPSNVAGAQALRDASAVTEAKTLDGIFQENYIWTSFASAWGAGGWFRYGGMDFGAGVGTFTANLAISPDSAGKQIELRLDSPTGMLVGALSVQSTGNQETWQIQSTSVSDSSGVHDLYLVFPQAWLGHIDWIRFDP